MTTSNHSPYEVPENYEPGPTEISDRLAARAEYEDGQARTLLETFQYASDALGQFMTRIKQSSTLRDKTIIAVSGDHRVRNLSAHEPTEYGLTYAVPFFLHVPDPVLENTSHRYDPMRIGSHRDIFPTLYHFSLSDQDYITLGGENLLDPDGVSNVGFNLKRTINEHGAFSNDSSGQYYPWQEDDPLLNRRQPKESRPFDTEWPEEYHRLMDYYLRYQVLATTPDSP